MASYCACRPRGPGGSIDRRKLERDAATMYIALACFVVVPMCKLHFAAVSCSNLHRSMLLPSPPDQQQFAMVVFRHSSPSDNTVLAFVVT